MNQEFRDFIKIKAAEKLLFLPHAARQMMLPERMISTSEVKSVVFEGEIIEDYPDDARGHSCLILGHGDGSRPLHVVCAPKDDYLAIITIYVPTSVQWTEDFKSRRPK